MELYFSPLACSLASRIALYELGKDAKFIQVDTKTKTLSDGSDYLKVNPLGQVPVLHSDDGEYITENPVVLARIAESAPNSSLLPHSGLERTKTQQWLNFVTSELHKLVFTPLLDSTSNDGARQYAREKAERLFAY